MSELETHGWPEMDPIKPDQRITVVYYNRSLLRHLAVAVLFFYFLCLYKGETYFVSCIFTHTSEYIYICWLKR